MARLHVVAVALLQAVSAAFERTPEPPEHQWVADGANPILDFGLESSLVVMWDGSRLEVDTGIDEASVILGNFSVYVWRPAPAWDPPLTPSTEAISEAARLQQDDAYVVFRSVLSGFADGSLLGHCGSGNILDQVPFGGDGGVEGSRLRVAVTL